jgi:hypothetical protein
LDRCEEPGYTINVLSMDTVWVARARGAQPIRRAHGFRPSRRRAAAWYGGFAVYAAGVAIFTGQSDRIWAAWAVGAYVVAALALWFGRTWTVPLVVALGGALAAPTAWLATHGQLPAEVTVIRQAAALLLKHGTPYLPVSQLTNWTSYNPYLPVMEIFGLPGAAGVRGLAGDPRVWLTLFTMALLAVAFGIFASDNPLRCAECRTDVIRCTALATASPIIAFPLALGITDPPVIALVCVALACVARGWILRAGLVLGAACAMKATAWPAVPVLAFMIFDRYAPRIAGRFALTAAAVAAGLAALAAPEAMASPRSVLQNTVAFPLGLTKGHDKTPAASPLPGHVLASLGTGGHLVAMGLMLATALGFVIWLCIRPPRDVRSVAWRLALGYAIVFALAPATRWGYFAYPLGLLGWLFLTPAEPATEPDPQEAMAPV